jgi:hypothetical protein
MLTGYPEDRDLYTAREIVSKQTGMALKDLDITIMRKTTKELMHQGQIVPAYGGGQIRWPGAGAKSSPERLYSIRNHRRYETVECLETIKEHMRRVAQPGTTLHGIAVKEGKAGIARARPRFECPTCGRRTSRDAIQKRHTSKV